MKEFASSLQILSIVAVSSSVSFYENKIHMSIAKSKSQIIYLFYDGGVQANLRTPQSLTWVPAVSYQHRYQVTLPTKA